WAGDRPTTSPGAPCWCWARRPVLSARAWPAAKSGWPRDAVTTRDGVYAGRSRNFLETPMRQIRPLFLAPVLIALAACSPSDPVTDADPPFDPATRTDAGAPDAVPADAAPADARA